MSWCLLGDFNNLIQNKDRIGVKLVTGVEYIDLTTMMSMVGLFEKDSVDDYYKWSNKQTKGEIYYRINRILGNMD